MAKIVMDPISRIEGHLSVELDVADGSVASAHVRGDMFRGFEKILIGRNPFDAVQITQRICGVCPISHGITSSRTVESGCGITPNRNGMLLRNLTLAANFLQSHILHFYHLAALDYIDITAVARYTGGDKGLNSVKAWVLEEIRKKKDGPYATTAGAPFLPRYEGEGIYITDDAFNLTAIAHYVQALDIRMKAHRLTALLAGRVPHAIGLVPGGLTGVPDAAGIDEAKRLLEEIETFVNTAYYPDIVVLAKTIGDGGAVGRFDDFMSYGEFPENTGGTGRYFPRGIVTGKTAATVNEKNITEQVAHSRYSSPSDMHPSRGETEAQVEKSSAYSWLKAPRYSGKPLEVGPLARIIVGYMAGHTDIVREVGALTAELNVGLTHLTTAVGRHAARMIECRLLCTRAKSWLGQLSSGDMPRVECAIPDSGDGVGMGEAPRGALGHWISIREGKIGRYQCVVPTTWNASPRDDNGTPGPIEQALVGTPIRDAHNPIEAARIIRSFDPCIACAVHAVEGGKNMARFRVC